LTDIADRAKGLHDRVVTDGGALRVGGDGAGCCAVAGWRLAIRRHGDTLRDSVFHGEMP
jgi:hypothetical protein